MAISKLYYSQPRLRELETRIVSQREQGDKHLVVLAETIFYPTGAASPMIWEPSMVFPCWMFLKKGGRFTTSCPSP